MITYSLKQEAISELSTKTARLITENVLRKEQSGSLETIHTSFKPMINIVIHH